MKLFLSVVVSLVVLVCGQQPGTVKPEVHPPLTVKICTKSGGCQTEQKSVVLDANWRWVHNTGGYTNCFTGTTWNPAYCPDGKTCAQKCALDGADYSGTYGIQSSGSSLKIGFVTGSNVGSRVYLMDSETEYFMFKGKNKEFAFDVDVSNLPCGLNGALYFVNMDADGGMSKYPTNKAGAKFGTGYCDAQCPHDIKFINGEANTDQWNTTSAMGKYGSCCMEMDIWEANSISTAYTPHSCSVQAQTRCSGVQCGDNANGQRHMGVCDKDGCDFNSYRLGDKSFYGPTPSDVIDSTKVFTVVTQFVTTDGTDAGDLKEIRRTWIQNGKIVQTRNVTLMGKQYNSVSDDFCAKQKQVFGDPNDFAKHGGLQAMGQALEKGMVLTLSLWDDHAAYMLWLDSDFPTNESPTKAGVARGSCAVSSGRPNDVEKNHPGASVTFSNIRWGEMASTYELKHETM